MALLVVPLGADAAGALTVAEWDLLTQCSRVVFEDPGHPLIERLMAHGIHAGPFDDEPAASDDGLGLVAEPASLRIVELARTGAIVTGPFDPPDPLTAAHGAPVTRAAARSLARLVAVMARLRSVDGCPWDREQTHRSLGVHLLEEAYEVIDAIDRDEVTAELEEELGDVLLQVVFHARLADQDGRFDVAEVADHLVAKLLHRHPHVFGETTVSGAEEVVANWEAIKSREKARTGPFDGIPKHLPALLAAYKSQKRAAARGFQADGATALEELRRVLDRWDAGAAGPELLGDALFWTVALARATGLDPEEALRGATLRFRGMYA